MRPKVIVCALVAGTAARLILSRIRRLGRQQSHSDLSTSNEIETIVSEPDPSSKYPLNPQVLALLDEVAPVIRGSSFLQSHHGDDPDCTFCLESITASSAYVRVTPCRHVFHAECLQRWVMHTAITALDWRHYIVNENGTVDVTVPPPTCPNCTKRLPVLPARLVRHAMLTSIAQSLSLPSLFVAARMYDAGVLFRSPPLSIHYPQAHSVTAPLVRPTTHISGDSSIAPSPPPSTPATSLSTHRLPASTSDSDEENISVSPIAIVPPPNIRTLDRNTWGPPFFIAGYPHRYASVISSHVLEAAT